MCSKSTIAATICFQCSTCCYDFCMWHQHEDTGVNISVITLEQCSQCGLRKMTECDTILSWHQQVKTAETHVEVKVKCDTAALSALGLSHPLICGHLCSHSAVKCRHCPDSKVCFCIILPCPSSCLSRVQSKLTVALPSPTYASITAGDYWFYDDGAFQNHVCYLDFIKMVQAITCNIFWTVT